MDEGFRWFGLFIIFVSIGTSVSALITERWGCGGLFTGCQNTEWKTVAAIVGGLTVAGTFCMVVLFVIEFLSLCIAALRSSRMVLIVRYILVLLAMACTLTAVLFYTAKIGRMWSYFLAVCSGVLCVQVGFLLVVREFTKSPHSGMIRIE
ncbi:hypothetical protein CSKR_107459 [Clonorchis sinensis]|uniref:Neutral sphingomyelinase n=2 Tax=Clonorchis sinensis TaxID=79923 RepID=G7YEJ2_CLOSI|nr:hypothetical protein CSKR_107459 [Clonorchis sinensis]GAA51375.1 neutral sphingomyelinase [Clonorchis sinensis]